METPSSSVREMRRRAALARDIVAEHTGPLHRILGWARKYPMLTAGAAVAIGVIVAVMLRKKR